MIRIPTRFCVNVQIAGAIVMYDRLHSLGQFADRPVMPGGDKGAQFTPKMIKDGLPIHCAGAKKPAASAI